MDYSFNGEIARLYGVDEAVFIHNLYWWIAKNEANGRHYHDGRSWTYNSMKAFTELFPFWTEKQVRRIIGKLEGCGALLVGNFNPLPFDRTQWYALSDEVNEVYQKGSIDSPKRANDICPNGQMTSAQTGAPIPDSKPDSKPDGEGAKAPRPKFQKPTLKEITAYCLACQIQVDAQKFYDHYESNGWRVGRNPMKDWHAALRNWWRREEKPQRRYRDLD